jgi:diguanylate cyclase (GGDEF)-like protein
MGLRKGAAHPGKRPAEYHARADFPPRLPAHAIAQKREPAMEGSLVEILSQLQALFTFRRTRRQLGLGKGNALTLESTAFSHRAERKSMKRAHMDGDPRCLQAAEVAVVLDAVPAAVWIAHDTECKVITANRTAYELLRRPPGTNLSLAQSQTRRRADFSVYHNGRPLAANELPIHMVAARGIEVREFEMDIVFDDGTITHLIGNATPLQDSQGKVYGAVAVFVDVSGHKNAEEHLRHMAYFDTLTNLPNRALMMDRLEHALAMAARNHTGTGVVFVDLDHFKTVNDTLGHEAGDLLLQQVADRLRYCVRRIDTVSRLGGDEFVVVLPELRRADDARHIARKLLQCLSADYLVARQKFKVTPSIGISIYPDHAEQADTLIQLADQAMYKAKHDGRGTVRIYGT